MTGLLEVTGPIDRSQFWPDGDSDADTAKVRVGQNAFKFQPHPGAPLKVTHIFDRASVKGKTGTKAAIDKKGRITISSAGHRRDSAALPGGTATRAAKGQHDDGAA